MVRQLAVFPLVFAARGLPAASASLTPRARVAAPRIQRQPGCLAQVTVAVDLMDLVPGTFYELTGDLLEWDEPDDDPDLCCHFMALPVPAEPASPRPVLLTARVLASQLGLVKGAGPARDETSSPDLVELVARVWLRDLTAGTAMGPWDSPVRLAVASANLAWTPEDEAPGSLLQVPRESRAGGAWPTIGQPPQACSP